MNATGVTNRDLRLRSALVGHWRAPAFAQVNVLGSVVFLFVGTGLRMCGGQQHRDQSHGAWHGYPPAFAAAITAASALLVRWISPSIAVIYAFIANVSVGRILVAGIIPGLLMAAAMMFDAHLFSRQGLELRGQEATLRARIGPDHVLCAARPPRSGHAVASSARLRSPRLKSQPPSSTRLCSASCIANVRSSAPLSKPAATRCSPQAPSC